MPSKFLPFLCYITFHCMWGNNLKKIDTCTCIAESLLCIPETNTTLLINYTSLQNKKIFTVVTKSMFLKCIQHIYLQCRRPRFNPWVGKISWRRKWQPTPVLLPGKSDGQRSLVGYSPWGRKESDTTE